MQAVDFQSTLTAALQQSLSKLTNVSAAFHRRIITFPSARGMNEAFDRSTANAVLFLDIIYFIDDVGLSLKGEALLFPRSEQLKRFRPKPDESNPTAPGNVIFRQTLERFVPTATINYGGPGQLEASIVDAIDNLVMQLVILLDHGT